MLVQKVQRHFRGCGILPRPSGWIEECLTQSPQRPPREREEIGRPGIHKNVPNAAERPRMAGRREGCLH
jgi:hypothetical protein